MRFKGIILVGSIFFSLSVLAYDVTLVGSLQFGDGLGRLAIGLIEHLHKKASINFISSRGIVNLLDVPEVVKNVIENEDRSPGNVALLVDPLWHLSHTAAYFVPHSPIKIAYSMLESTAIPVRWVELLNTDFDAVVVPDKFYVEVYEKSGVKIPIFVLPTGLYLEEFLEQPLKKSAGKPFTFGMSAGFWPHKNHLLLLEAFIAEFGNSPEVQLKLHGRFGDPTIQNALVQRIQSSGNTNISFQTKLFSRKEYLDFVKSFDCYAFLSRGEGFSNTPREAMALGIPCILSNNTAHKTICNTGLVYSIPASIRTPADYRPFFGDFCGEQFQCSCAEIRKALRAVYENYQNYLQKAPQARAWVKQYLYPRLANKYLSLLKPKKVFLGTANTITDGALITNSKKLYDKYRSLIKKSLQPQQPKLSLCAVKTPSNGSLSSYFLNLLQSLSHAFTLIESGTFLGTTALRAAELFKKVHTIELCPLLCQKAQENLKQYPHVTVHQGDSSTVLSSLAKNLYKPVVFWLDGHYSGTYFGHQTARGTTITPLLEELKALEQSEIKDGLIVINNIRLCDNNLTHLSHPTIGGFPSLKTVKQALRAINPGYKIVILGDILIAYPSETIIRSSCIAQACTISRFYDGTNIPINNVLKAEKLIAHARGAERFFLQKLFATWCTNEETFKYGVGRHYILWYGLMAFNERRYADAYSIFTAAYNHGLTHWRVAWYLAQAAYKAGFLNNAQYHIQEALKQAPFYKELIHLYDAIIKAQNERSKCAKHSPYDLTVLGVIRYADGLGRLPISMIDMLNDKLKINFITSRINKFINLDEVSDAVKAVAQDVQKRPGKVALFCDLMWVNYDKPYLFIPSSTIKIAYTMVESSAVPTQWVEVLNSYFDAAIVPDEALVEVYKQSGVKIPLFVLPCPLYLEEFLTKEPKKQKNMPFVFGISAGFWPRKNQKMVIEAFIKEFGNSPDVQLKLHGRFGEESPKQELINLIKKYKVKNIEFIEKSFSRAEYLSFMASLDCYVFLSKGEGFSITPREALALGIPCIVSNNTAQKTICATDYVRSVSSCIQEPAYYSHIGTHVGYEFNCTLYDAQKALRDVYENYHLYLKKAEQGREWVKQYHYTNLKQKFLSLVKPQSVLLSDRNSIEDTHIATTSRKLYEKYKFLSTP